MANGKVIIGSNVPGIRDQLIDFPHHLFHPSDVVDLKDKLVQFMSNNIDENTMIGNKFIDIVYDKFELTIEKELLQSFYLQLINNID